MTFDEIVEGARKTTGLPDPDKDSWQEGLHRLMQDHTDAGMLTEQGRGILKQRYITALATRMRVDDYIRRHPEVLDTPIERPVFVLGLVRTGTTMTSYLMGTDPANRLLLRWEAYNVAPPAPAGALRTDARCLAEFARDRQILERHPEAAATHFEPADSPTECVHLLAQDFRSMMYAALSTTPVYTDWLLRCDMRSAFEHRKRVFHILQSTNPGRWVLKMPSDAVFIPWLFQTFPDAKVIWTHRDPYRAFASSFSMRSKSWMIFNKHLDHDYMRSKWPPQLALHLQRPLQLARERPNDIYNLYYDEMMADPIGQMKKVYAWLGDEWTEAAETSMKTWLAENPQGRYGKHSYALTDFGYTDRDLEPYFREYLEVHPVAKRRSGK